MNHWHQSILSVRKVRAITVLLLAILLVSLTKGFSDASPAAVAAKASEQREATLQAVIDENQLSTEAARLSLIGHYASGLVSPDGGSEEVVAFDPANQRAYAVNGIRGMLDVIDLSGIKDDGRPSAALNAVSINVKALVMEVLPGNVTGGSGRGLPEAFMYGDMTSVAVSAKNRLVAVALQDANPDRDGLIALLGLDGRLIDILPAGRQPDMICFSAHGNYLLSANEGEPRDGYGSTAIDPAGSVTIVQLNNGHASKPVKSVTTIGFGAFDSTAERSRLVRQAVILKKGVQPSVDLEPEGIAIDQAEQYAYISLQEANAVAVLDLSKAAFKDVYGLGFKDFSLPGNELDMIKDGRIAIVNEQTYGVRMPDGIALFETQGKTFLLTANEGDSREWPGYLNEKEIKIKDKKVVTLDISDYDGLFNPEGRYLFGGRSFSILQVNDNGLIPIFDSGSDFETITAAAQPDHFNCSNNNVDLDSRSGKKGPEPEMIVIGEVDGRYYAFIGLERIGGIMTYDITEPALAAFSDYCSSRDYSAPIAGDVAPEGLCFVDAKASPTGLPMLLAANEVSGTISVYGTNNNIASR